MVTEGAVNSSDSCIFASLIIYSEERELVKQHGRETWVGTGAFWLSSVGLLQYCNLSSLQCSCLLQSLFLCSHDSPSYAISCSANFPL